MQLCSIPEQRTSQGDPKETNEFKTKEAKATQIKKRGQVSKKGKAKRQALGARKLSGSQECYVSVFSQYLSQTNLNLSHSALSSIRGGRGG